MSDIEDNMSDIDDDIIDDEFIDDEFIDDDNKKKVDEEDDNYEDYDEDEEILKKQFEIEQEEIEKKENNIVYIVQDTDRTTSEKLSEYEIAELINIRAVNISNGGKVYTNIDGLDDPIEMAKKELIDRKCPLYIKRQVGYNDYGIIIEKWSPNHMIHCIKLNE